MVVSLSIMLNALYKDLLLTSKIMYLHDDRDRYTRNAIVGLMNPLIVSDLLIKYDLRRSDLPTRLWRRKVGLPLLSWYKAQTQKLQYSIINSDVSKLCI